MKKKLSVMSLLLMFLLVACGQGGIDDVTLKNQDNVDVSFLVKNPHYFSL